jgi:type IV secretory pathway component VirB8
MNCPKMVYETSRWYRAEKERVKVIWTVRTVWTVIHMRILLKVTFLKEHTPFYII